MLIAVGVFGLVELMFSRSQHKKPHLRIVSQIYSSKIGFFFGSQWTLDIANVYNLSINIYNGG